MSLTTANMDCFHVFALGGAGLDGDGWSNNYDEFRNHNECWHTMVAYFDFADQNLLELDIESVEDDNTNRWLINLSMAPHGESPTADEAELPASCVCNVTYTIVKFTR